MKKNYGLLVICWSAFHLVALILSYSRIDIFNNTGRPNTKIFWPFVKFMKENNKQIYIGDGFSMSSNNSKFAGLFTEYDWTECAIYIIIGLVFFAYCKKKFSLNS